MSALRWLLVLPAFFAGPLVAFVLSFLLLLAVDSLCSSHGEKACTASYIAALNHIAIAAGCFVGAAIAILFPTVLAPRLKNETATLALVLGAVAFGYVLVQFGAIFPAYLVALIVLVLCVTLVRRRYPNAT